MEFCLGSLETAPLRKVASQLSPAVPNHRLSTIPDQVRDARADEAQEAHMTWDPLGLPCFPLSCLHPQHLGQPVSPASGMTASMLGCGAEVGDSYYKPKKSPDQKPGRNG